MHAFMVLSQFRWSDGLFIDWGSSNESMTWRFDRLLSISNSDITTNRSDETASTLDALLSRSHQHIITRWNLSRQIAALLQT